MDQDIYVKKEKEKNIVRERKKIDREIFRQIDGQINIEREREREKREKREDERNRERERDRETECQRVREKKYFECIF